VLELREVLRAEYRNRPPEQIEQIFESTLGVSQEDLEDLEDFWKTLQGVGGAVSKALPGIASGALTGAGTGAALGPWGALGGALIGGTVGGLTHSQQPQRPSPQGPPLVPQTPVPPGPPSAPSQPQIPLHQTAPPTPTPVSGGSPAAAQLLQTILRPETLQALMAMLMGQAGRQNIPIGNTQVPTSAFANMLGSLANQAAAEFNAVTAPAYGESPSYWQNFAGEATGDPAVAEHRARALWELLQETGPGARRSYGSLRESQAYQEDDRELHEQFYDAMDLAEVAGEY
jgi:hypothetical protein